MEKLYGEFVRCMLPLQSDLWFNYVGACLNN